MDNDTCGCAAFFWSAFVIFIGLLLIVVIFANPWIFVLVALAMVLAALYQLGKLAFQHFTITLIVIGIIALLVYLGAN
jgi:1,4-dihydroxy-2-naphthoate octaprenyltransferase